LPGAWAPQVFPNHRIVPVTAFLIDGLFRVRHGCAFMPDFCFSIFGDKNMDLDARDLISTHAPALAAARDGNISKAAEAAIGKALGLGDQPLNADIVAALATASPDVIPKLKQAEQDFTAKMTALVYKGETDLAKIAAGDRDSARQQEEERHDWWTPRVLAFLVTAGFFTMLGIMIFHPPSDNSKDSLLILLGSLGTAWTTIMAYYFGSTSGAEKKSAMLAKATLPSQGKSPAHN
jgi:hypothetical protein